MAFVLEDDFFDPTLSVEGVWLDFFNGSRVKLAATDNKQYKAAIAKLAKAHKLQLDTSNEDSFEIVNRITCECLAKYVLLDWTGFSLNGIDDVPYSIEVGIKALTKSQKLRDFVSEQAATASNFQKVVAEAVKPL